MYRFRLLLIVIYCLFLLGCQGRLNKGHYEGNLMQKTETGLSIFPVQMELSYPNEKSFNPTASSYALIQLSDEFHKKLGEFQVSYSNYGGIQIHFGGFYGLNKVKLKQTLYKDEFQPYWCFGNTKRQKIKLCFSQSRFNLEVSEPQGELIFKVWGNKFKKENSYHLEKPQSLNLVQSIDAAVKKNFESRHALEAVIQAKNNALAAWLNLIPHVNMNIVWNVPPSIVGAAATINLLAPFLLPSYWLDAEKSELHAEIVQDALLIVRADLAYHLETLFYAFERDNHIINIHHKMREALYQIEAKYLALHSQMGLLSESQISDVKDSLLESMDENRMQFERVLREDRWAIGLTVGMHNPDAVTDVITPPELTPLDQVEPIVPQNLAELARHRSFELSQVDSMIEIAHISEVELYVGWFNPNGDANASLGFNWIPQSKVKKSEIRELRNNRDQIATILYYNSYRVANEFNEALDHLKKIQTPTPVEKKVEELEALFFNPSTNFDAEDLKKMVNEYVSDWVNYEAAIAGYRSARAKKDRLMLSGYFEQVMPQWVIVK